MRSILSEKTDLLSKNIGFEYNSYGKPGLRSSQNSSNLRFNVSHSGDYGLIAITKNNQIGIDIEKRNGMKDMESILKSQFSEEEYNALALTYIPPTTAHFSPPPVISNL